MHHDLYLDGQSPAAKKEKEGDIEGLIMESKGKKSGCTFFFLGNHDERYEVNGNIRIHMVTKE
jgi:hypothetical protein